MGCNIIFLSFGYQIQFTPATPVGTRCVLVEAGWHCVHVETLAESRTVGLHRDTTLLTYLGI
jgi:hypothetical protein